MTPMQDPMKILSDADQPEGRRIEAAKAIAKDKDISVIDRLFFIADRAETILSRAIIDALREMGAVDVLANRIAQAPDAALRAESVKKLGRLQDERSADALIGAAKDKELSVRRAALHGLSFLKPGIAKVFDALQAGLRDADPETRAYAAAGVGRSGDTRAPRLLAAAREAEQDDLVKDFIEAALRKLTQQPAAK